MKVTAAFVVASVAGYAAAQSACLAQAESISSCGQSCLISAASQYGCQSTDFQCQCSHSSEIQNSPNLTRCVVSACPNVNDAEAVSRSAVALCSCVAQNGGSGGGAAAGTSTAAVPTTTVALGTVPAAAAPAATTAAATKAAAASTTKMPMFTGAGAVYTAGSIGGIFAGVLGLIAAL